MFQVKNASGARFDSRFCSFDGNGLGYASYFWWDRFNSFMFMFTLWGLWMFSMYEKGQLKITSLLRLGLLEWLETPLVIKTARATFPYVQPEMKFRSSSGQFHHEPPLVATTHNAVHYSETCNDLIRLLHVSVTLHQRLNDSPLSCVTFDDKRLKRLCDGFTAELTLQSVN